MPTLKMTVTSDSSVFFRTVCLILLFSQYLSKVDVPMIAYKDKKWKVFQYPLFKLFSVSRRPTKMPSYFSIWHMARSLPGSLWHVRSLAALFPTHHLRGLSLHTRGVWLFGQDRYQHPRCDRLSLVLRAISW